MLAIMNRKVIFIIGGAAIVIFGVLFFFASRNGGTSSGSASGTAPQSAKLIVPDVSSAMPADAPQTDTFNLQTQTGSVTVKNFYKTAEGYAPNVDGILIAQTSTYSIWYYRGIASFAILPAASAGSEDISSAEKDLMTTLGIGMGDLCSLSVSIVYQVDGGKSDQEGPLPDCSNGAFGTGN